MPQTHISGLPIGVGAGALLTAVCGSFVIVRECTVCGVAVGIGANLIRKGECGKIAIFGGCVLYTGTPHH